jgi:hypothetical protein
LSTQRGKTCTHDIGHPFVVLLGNNTQQLLQPFAPDRRDDPEFGKMGSYRIDYSRLPRR